MRKGIVICTAESNKKSDDFVKIPKLTKPAKSINSKKKNKAVKK